MKTSNLWVVLGIAFCTAGCASVDKMGAKLDMTEQHLGSEPKPYYEGKLQSFQKIGAMTALRFSDGQDFDVAEAPAGLAVGDTVRIYQTEDQSYQAHLWHSAPDLPSPEASALAPAILSK